MTIHEKIERLTEFSSKSAVSSAAHLGPNFVGAVLRRRSAITTKAAVAIANVLEVDPGWLVDDSKGWPPVRIETSSAA
jgi:hypothetical protein